MTSDLITSEQKFLALAAHLSWFVGGVGFILAPLIIFLFKQSDPFVQYHARQALVVHLVLLGATIAVMFLSFLLVGLLFIPAIVLLWCGLAITSIIASIKVINGQLYQYPFIQQLVNRL